MQRPGKLKDEDGDTHSRRRARTWKVLAHSTQLAHHGDALRDLRDEDVGHNEAGGHQAGKPCTHP